jgi:hypothetical protein
MIPTTALLLAIVNAGWSDGGHPRSPLVATLTERNQTLVEKARSIHDRVVTVDSHADINVANFTPAQNYTSLLDTQVNLPKMIDGGQGPFISRDLSRRAIVTAY